MQEILRYKIQSAENLNYHFRLMTSASKIV